MLGMLSFLFLLCAVAFVLSTAFLIVRTVKKQPKKLFVIMTTVSFVLAIGLTMPISSLYEPNEKPSTGITPLNSDNPSTPETLADADNSTPESITDVVPSDSDINADSNPSADPDSSSTKSTVDDEKAKQEKDEKEQAEREKAEKEAQEKAKREKAEKEAQEKAEREKAEKEAQEKAEREKAEKEAQEKAEREKAEKEKQKEVQKEKNKRKEIKSAIKEIVGADSLESFNYVPDNNFSLIKFKGSDNLTTNMTIKGMYLDIFDILKAIQPIIDTDVDFNVTYPLQDGYGNVKDIIVIKATFTNETINKINFDNVLWENTPDLADEWWNHDAVRLTN